MSAAGFVIFAITYLLVSARRVGCVALDRPVAALLGAVACVATGVLGPDEAIGSVDGSTLLLLFAVMGMGAFLVLDGFLDVVESRLSVGVASPAALLGRVVWGSGLLAAFVTNDAVCVLGTPLVVRMVRRNALPPVPFLLALATGANTGSVATLIGNPQNMLCGLLGDLSYLEYALAMVPLAVVALAANHGILAWSFRRELASRIAPDGRPEPVAPFTPRHAFALGVIAVTAVVYSLGAPMAWTAAGGLVLLLLVHRRDARDVWAHIDWSLLLFFAGLFVVVEGLRASGATDWAFARWPLGPLADGPWSTLQLAGVFLVGSNAVSNVPFILVVRDQVAALPDPRTAWELLAMASTFAGNLTLLGSAANVIVAEASRDVGSFGFLQHLRVGLPTAIATTAIGAVWLLVLHGGG